MLKSPRWDEYSLSRDGWVYSGGARRSPYHPSDKHDLPHYLARINRTDSPQQLDRLLEFYRNFGLLGQSMLEGRPRPITVGPSRKVRIGPSRMRRPLKRFEGQAEGTVALERIEKLADGDNLAWALAHAENVDWILSLLAARGATFGRLMDRAVAQARERQVLIPTIAPPWWIPLDLEKMRSWQDLIAQRLNPNLLGVNFRYNPESGEAELRFRALVEVVYWQLADKIGVRGPRRCRCGMYFFPRDERQRFCPPPPGVRESRCGRRFRMQKSRRK